MNLIGSTIVRSKAAAWSQLRNMFKIFTKQCVLRPLCIVMAITASCNVAIVSAEQPSFPSQLDPDRLYPGYVNGEKKSTTIKRGPGGCEPELGTPGADNGWLELVGTEVIDESKEPIITEKRLTSPWSEIPPNHCRWYYAYERCPGGNATDFPLQPRAFTLKISGSWKVETSTGTNTAYEGSVELGLKYKVIDAAKISGSVRREALETRATELAGSAEGEKQEGYNVAPDQCFHKWSRDVQTRTTAQLDFKFTYVYEVQQHAYIWDGPPIRPRRMEVVFSETREQRCEDSGVATATYDGYVSPEYSVGYDCWLPNHGFVPSYYPDGMRQDKPCCPDYCVRRPWNEINHPCCGCDTH